MRKALFAVAISFGLTWSCHPKEMVCYGSNNYKNITDYDVVPDVYTANGIGIDNSNNPEWQLNPVEIDFMVDSLEECLNANFKANPIIPEDIASSANCYRKDFSEGITIVRNCISVKVPDDLYRSSCSGKLLFRCDVDPQLCLDKGLEPNPACPCSCRAMIQDNNCIITEPTFEVFKGELARMVTSCNNPWRVGQIAPCLSRD